MRTCRPDMKGEAQVVTPRGESTDAGHRDGLPRSSAEAPVTGVERRGQVILSDADGQPDSGRSCQGQTKPFTIPKALVYQAYKRVRANQGGAGIDDQSLKDFDQDLGNNLYRIWNRLSSGSYHPPPVLRVEIEKSDGGTRCLGIPTVADRIAQMVVKLLIEPELEQHFHPDSYGYRPGKSAHNALKQTLARCWKRAWVLDMDIQGFFDNIDHGLLMKAVDRHVTEDWQKLYIRRWLCAPVQLADGAMEPRDRGTPQGGVISPLLANLFLHYVFDLWIEKRWEGIEFERYADDIVCHCVSEREAQTLRSILEARFKACGLTLHPQKTKIVYCKGGHHRQDYPVIAFDFLSYTFRPRLLRTRQGQKKVYFTAAISQKAAKAIRKQINEWPWKSWRQRDLGQFARFCQARLRGWMHYYGLFGRSFIQNVLFHFDLRLSRWAVGKYRKLRGLLQAARRVNGLRRRRPSLFAHWAGSRTMIG